MLDLLAVVHPVAELGGILERQSLWLSLLAIFVGGMALNLTPCVYPLIPVTLAFFSSQGSGLSVKTLWLALCYVVGISLSYAFLGVVAVKAGALVGSWLQQPVVLIGVAALIGALALGMFGLYELRPPRLLTRRFGRASAGPGGAVVMGLAVGLIAAPCIGPFVLGLMLFVSQLANPLTGFLLFFLMGLGMGLPYVVLALGTQWVTRLPKAGAWLIWSKKVLGIVLLGLALYLLKPLLPLWVVTLSGTLLLAGAGMYVGWLERSTSPSRLFPWIRRAVGVGFLVAGVVVALPQPSARAAVEWKPFREATFHAALKRSAPIVVDVYADWCLPCLELDHVTFRHPDVAAKLSAMTTLRLDATHELSEDAEAFIDRHRIYGVPMVLLFDGTGRERRELRVTGFLGPGAFLRRLEQLERAAGS